MLWRVQLSASPVVVPAGQDYQPIAVQANRSINVIGRIRIDQPMLQKLTTPGLLQRPLQMGCIGRGAQSHGEPETGLIIVPSFPTLMASRRGDRPDCPQ